MKKMTCFTLSLFTAAACLCAGSAAADAPSKFEQTKPLRIASVNFKTVVEKSKLGQKEQTAFDAMKKQMETILEEKEKALTDVANKFNDIDYLDSLSPDAEAELKRQFRTLNQEYTQIQNQFYQTLSQSNMLVVQKLTDDVTKAAEEVAKANNIDVVLNSESAFYSIPAIDISQQVIRALDDRFEKEGKDTKPATVPAIPTKK
jgi:outer membrane protein